MSNFKIGDEIFFYDTVIPIEDRIIIKITSINKGYYGYKYCPLYKGNNEFKLPINYINKNFKLSLKDILLNL